MVNTASNFLIMLKNLSQMHLKLLLKEQFKKKKDTTGDTAITKVSKTSQQNNSEIVTNEHDKEIPKEIKISPEETQKIIDDLKLINQYNNGISKINKFVRQYTKSTI